MGSHMELVLACLASFLFILGRLRARSRVPQTRFLASCLLEMYISLGVASIPSFCNTCSMVGVLAYTTKQAYQKRAMLKRCCFVRVGLNRVSFSNERKFCWLRKPLGRGKKVGKRYLNY
ncbi:hypothetical protein DM860_011558 [Cuscuta australis]|uniref:Secreted protein n=1 Tax=Cuscuta australis TaxID=267555 RepID=A0A328D009_9ASTE|nr:hypothetical protein DM860_011558 [Cuscuta australis]